MKVTVTIKKEVEVFYLQAKCGVRYWEDATINNVEDTEGDLIPCREKDYWCPLIDVKEGKILNWEQGKTADVHFKICDDGEYTLLDENNNQITKKEGYVPDVMCPAEEGCGDYVIMEIDENGFIQDWKEDYSDFEIEE